MPAHDIHAEADRLLERARRLEPAVTEDMRSVAEEVGAALAGLDSRLKARDGLIRKIEQTLRSTGRPGGLRAREAAERVPDSLRYTMLLREDVYAQKTLRIVQLLRELGYAVVGRPHNHWAKPGYQGFHVIFRKNDHLLELQFHTTASYEMKDLTHPLYKLLREEEDDVRRAAFFDARVALWEGVPIPLGAIELDPTIG